LEAATVSLRDRSAGAYDNAAGLSAQMWTMSRGERLRDPE